MKMIPGLKLPLNFKLKRKPNYLQKTHCHRARTLISPQSKKSLQTSAQMPPPPSLTPPPSPPTSLSPSPLPAASMPAFLIDGGKSIKHSMSHDELQKMTQFALKIRPCDDLPEFTAAIKKSNVQSTCSGEPSNQPIWFCTDDGDEHSTVVDVQSEIEFVEVKTDGIWNGDESFKSLRYSSSESSHLNKSPKNFDKNQSNDNKSNEESNVISNDATSEETHAIEQPDITDDIEVPSPPIEPIVPATVDQPLPINHEQLILNNRNQLEMLKEQLEKEYNSEIHRLNGIINQNRSTIAHHIEKEIKLQTENVELKQEKTKMHTEIEQLKKRLTAKDAELGKLQQQHFVELQMTMDEIKTKQWCVNCKKEASITQYKVPVCSLNCLFVYL